jgi:CHRD domain
MRGLRPMALLLPALTLVIALSAGTALADNGGRPFNLALSGANEFDAAGQPINPHGDADRGSVVLTINPGQEEVCWSFGAITLTAGEALPHVAHIHLAPAGIAGPVAVDIFGGAASAPAPTSYPTGTTCVHGDRDILAAILRDPGAYYMNLHNAQHPGGVMRAQLG